MFKRYVTVTSFALLAALAACGGDAKEEASATPEAAAPAAASPGGELTPGPGGEVIEVAMITDDKGNYFEPKEIEAHPGDVLRFVLKSGVHNVHFVADSNPGRQGLPPASEMLQLPGQTWDFAVPTAEGRYYFQCDPHALLGMIGHLEVEREDD